MGISYMKGKKTVVAPDAEKLHKYCGEEFEIEINAAENDVSQAHTATIDVAEDAYIYLIINKGLRSEGEFVMSRPYDSVLQAQSYPKEAKIAQSGAILPLTGTHRLTFLSLGVETLKVELGRLIDSDVNHLASQTRGEPVKGRLELKLYRMDFSRFR